MFYYREKEMIFNNVLDHIFASRSHIRVLRALRHSAKGLTGREVARISKLSHRSCLKALTNLEELSIVSRQRGGRDHSFTLNREKVLVQKGLIPLLSFEQKYLNQLTLILVNEIGRSTESMIIFGSVARKEEDTTSDLDICLVYRTKAQFKNARKKLDEINPNIREQFGVKISPIFFSVNEFKSRAKSGSPPVTNILKDGKVLSGLSLNILVNGKEK